MTAISRFVGLCLALGCGAANAIAVIAIQKDPGLFTSKPGVCTVDFNSLASLTGCSGATYSTGNEGIAAHIVTGSIADLYAQPAGDSTPFLTVGPFPGMQVTISLVDGANYFGFYAGSIDDYNSIILTPAAGTPTVLTGSEIAAAVNGSANGSQNGYFNIFTDSLFNSITIESSANAFETDNHSFGIASVPEPPSIALIGLGSLALLLFGRRHRNG
jgi:hypothetical protein